MAIEHPGGSTGKAKIAVCQRQEAFLVCRKARAMNEIYLGFKAYDIHELLCHGVAETGGLYAEAGIKVKLLDTTFLPDDAIPKNTFHAACAMALAKFLSGDQLKVLFVACDRPMFWLYGRAGVDSIEQLANGQVATYPEGAPPGKFLERLLQNADITADLIPSRDDVARLALLASGSVDAALLSSCFMPAEVELRGCESLAFIGENLRIPSTGLAVSNEFIERQPELVAAMTAVYQQAMNIIFAQDETVLRKVLVSHFRMPPGELDPTVQIIRHCYTHQGCSSESLLQSAMDNVAASMGLTTRAISEFYDFRYLKS